MEDPLVQESLQRRDALFAAYSDSCPADEVEEEDLEMDVGGTSPEFMDCLTEAISEDMAKKEGEANFNMRVLQQVGDRARNYTCSDPSMETTQNSIREFAWRDAEEDESYNTKVCFSLGSGYEIVGARGRCCRPPMGRLGDARS